VAFLFADDANNPFQQDIAVNVPTPNVRSPSASEVETLRITTGLILRLPAGWTSSVEYGWSRASTSNQTTFSPLDASAVPTLQGGALRDTTAFPIDFAGSLLQVPDGISGPFETSLKDTTVRLAGPLFSLPGGTFTLTALAEYRNEDVRDAFELFRPNSYTFYPSKTRSVTSYYAEGRAPLIAPSNGMPLVEALELQLSIRRDEYETRSVAGSFPGVSPGDPVPSLTYSENDLASTDWTVGIRYMPNADFTFRASYATGFVPPSLAQISPFESVWTFPFLNPPDPLRGNTSLNFPRTERTNGNSNLEPESSKSLSFGAIFEADWLPGLRLSIDYTQIHKTNEIVPFLSREFVLANEATFPERVVRGPNLPGDAPGWAGPVTQIDLSALNAARTNTSSYDIQFDYTFETEDLGSFQAYAVATLASEFRRQLLPGTSAFDAVGYSDDGAPLRWRGNFGLTWMIGPWSLSWSTQHYDSYRVTFANPSFSSTNLSRIQSQGSAHIPSQVYSDLGVRFALSDADGPSGTEFALGIQNVFDAPPPTVAWSIDQNGYSPYGDPRMRRFVIGLRKTF
jgi:outer membrane receptor protein involved in Fe transport